MAAGSMAAGAQKTPVPHQRLPVRVQLRAPRAPTAWHRPCLQSLVCVCARARACVCVCACIENTSPRMSHLLGMHVSLVDALPHITFADSCAEGLEQMLSATEWASESSYCRREHYTSACNHSVAVTVHRSQTTANTTGAGNYTARRPAISCFRKCCAAARA